ncbi:ImmA/IrrE family metallo-endopeptidase [Virgibacillus sp. FSP13]
MKYVMTPLEDLIKKLYQKIGVTDPDHPIDDIALRLDIDLIYLKHFPCSSRGCIVLDPRLSAEKLKEIFGHELAHVLYHVGIQLIMPEMFRQMQEYQARNFALHFCIPTFMLQQINFPEYRCQAISVVAETFGVTNEFAAERLKHYENQITGALFHEELLKCSETTTKYESFSEDHMHSAPYKR